MENDVILVDLRNFLDIEEDCTDFDSRILGSVNSLLSRLRLLGVDVPTGFRTSDTSKWSDLIPPDKYDIMYGSVKFFVECSVKLIFDPPDSGYFTNSIQKMITQAETEITML